MQAAEAEKIPLKIIRDTFAEKRTAYEAKLILVRPDHFVAWCANEGPADARATLRQDDWIGLAAPPHRLGRKRAEPRDTALDPLIP